MSASSLILPVIICGGAGSRLWPLSRRDEPKQFATLVGKTSLFQDTLARFASELFLPPAIICNAAHADTARAQADAVGAKLGAVVSEPFGRNTAACGVISALLGQKADGAQAVLMVPADHHITRPDAFVNRVEAALPATRDGHLVTFGITPTEPHTGFGYIERGAEIGAGHAVHKFHEKPDAEAAQRYIDSGRFSWNAGIFMFAPDALLGEFRKHAPDVLDAVNHAVRADGASITIDPDRFADVPSISFDYAIAERTDRAVVIAADIGWSDIGSYSALFELRSALGQPALPERAIVTAGESVFVDSDQPDLMVTVAGLNNLAVIIREGRVLVVDLGQDQTVKDVVNALPDEFR